MPKVNLPTELRKRIRGKKSVYSDKHLFAWALEYANAALRLGKRTGYRPVGELSIARRTFEQFLVLTGKEGIPASDVFMAVVWANQTHTELLGTSLMRQSDTPEADDLEMLSRAWKAKHAVPIGLVSGVLSRKTKLYSTVAHPFITGSPAVEALLERALDEFKLPKGGRMKHSQNLQWLMSEGHS